MSANKLAQNTVTVTLKERLRAFMAEHDLSRAQLATILQTPLDTLNNWLDKGRTPPGCLVPLMALLERRSQVRTWLGVHRKVEAAPRGKPFRKGNAHRFAKAKGASVAPGNSRKVD